jgi:hypothetical protein
LSHEILFNGEVDVVSETEDYIVPNVRGKDGKTPPWSKSQACYTMTLW